MTKMYFLVCYGTFFQKFIYVIKIFKFIGKNVVMLLSEQYYNIYNNVHFFVHYITNMYLLSLSLVLIHSILFFPQRNHFFSIEHVPISLTACFYQYFDCFFQFNLQLFLKFFLQVQILSLSSLLVYALKATHFPHSAAIAVPHIFYDMFLLLFSFKYCLILFLNSPLVYIIF